MNPSPSSPAHASDVDQQALDWFARRQRAFTAAEEAAFHAWLQADPAHRAALARWHDDWRQLDELPADGVAQLRRQLAADLAAEAKADLAAEAAAALAAQPAANQVTDLSANQAATSAAPQATDREAHHAANPATRHADGMRSSVPVSKGRRNWLAGLAAMAPRAALATVVLSAAGGGFLAWNRWQQQPLYAGNFRTQRGQQQDVTLPDGSMLRLDTDTRIAVALYRERREVRLLGGQAVFHVQGDQARPFEVLAGAVRVTVVGTRFSVRHTPDIPGADEIRVQVEEGRVRVTGGAGSPVMELGAGQRIAADADGQLGLIGRVAEAGIAPWRDGRITFDNTPLAQVLAEFGRYGSTGLQVRDATVAALRVTGTFDPQRLENFRRVLPRVLPVALRRDGAVTEIVANDK